VRRCAGACRGPRWRVRVRVRGTGVEVESCESTSFDVEAGGWRPAAGVGGGSSGLTMGGEGEGEEVCRGPARTLLEGEEDQRWGRGVTPRSGKGSPRGPSHVPNGAHRAYAEHPPVATTGNMKCVQMVTLITTPLPIFSSPYENCRKVFFPEMAY
jgi:hypothetical protein